MTTFRGLSASPPSLQRVTYLLLLSAAVMCTTARAATKEDYRELLTFLGLVENGSYSNDIRPTVDSDEPTEVFMTLYLQSLLEVNEKEQTLKTNTELEIEWEDDYLSWNPESFGNISTILMRQKLLWLPDIVMSNTVSSQTELGYKNLKLRITDDGIVVWNPTGIFDTSCEIDITYYPFDTQVCEIVFMTAVSLKSEIQVYIDKINPIDMSSFSPNGLWVLMNYSAENNRDEDTRTKITFRLQLQRRRSYYVLNIILPVLFLSLTSSLTFALPSDAGEKMGLSVTVLLAYAVYLTLVTDAMPHTSVQVSVMTVYLILLLAVSAASVVLSAVVLRFHHRPPTCPVTGCLVTLVAVLRKITCMDKLRPVGRGERSVGAEADHSDVAAEEEEEYQQKAAPLNAGRRFNSVCPTAVADSGFKDDGPRSNDCGGVTFDMTKAASGKEVAETLDRFILLLFTVFVFASTVTCFLILLIGAGKQESDSAALISTGRVSDDE